MTTDIVLTLLILLAAVVLFVTEKLRVDLVAILVMVSLVIAGLVTPPEALSGFSNGAVVTVWAVFILSAGLSVTGVANVIGRQVMRLAGQGEIRLLVIIMLTVAVLSAFMNNVGVAALFLSVVLTIARETNLPPSKLLLPLAIGSLLGGLTTLIGTPPNILASDALREFGLEPFQFFDFAPVGLIVTLTGIGFMALVGRHLLPNRDPVQAITGQNVDASEFYGLEERLTLVSVPKDSPLAGRTLAESRIGRTLGLTILGLQRQGRKQLTVRPDTVLASGDYLLALGRLDRLEALGKRPFFVVEEGQDQTLDLITLETGLGEWQIGPESSFLGRTIAEFNMRRQYGLNVLAIRRESRAYRTNLQFLPLEEGDTLLILGTNEAIAAARETAEFGDNLQIITAEPDAALSYQLHERMLVIRLPEGSPLAGQALVESNLRDLFGVVVLGIARDGERILAPSPDMILAEGDLLLIEGKPEELAVIRGLQGLEINHHLHFEQVEFESEMVGLVEVVLTPRSAMVNKSLRQIHFREKFDLSVLAIWREGRAFRTDLGDIPLQFGDAFLVYGPREKIKVLSDEPDYLVLGGELEEAPRKEKAPLAVIIMGAVVLTVLVGWLPISIAAVAGAAFMVLAGCLKMEEAYQQIDWRAVFLIAGMLPLGIAMEQTGAAQFLAEGMVSAVGGMGTTALIAGLFVLTSVASQFMPNPVVTVLMAPIAINTAVDLSLSPHALMMVVAIAASASFMSPVGHPANVLVMGPGGYRFSDYIKVGIPLTIVVLVVVLLVLPIFWPLAG